MASLGLILAVHLKCCSASLGSPSVAQRPLVAAWVPVTGGAGATAGAPANVLTPLQRHLGGSLCLTETWLRWWCEKPMCGRTHGFHAGRHRRPIFSGKGCVLLTATGVRAKAAGFQLGFAPPWMVLVHRTHAARKGANPEAASPCRARERRACTPRRCQGLRRPLPRRSSWSAVMVGTDPMQRCARYQDAALQEMGRCGAASYLVWTSRV